MTTASTHGDEVTVGHDRVTLHMTSGQSGGALAVIEVTMPPGGGPPMLHRHDPFELYCVRRGELAIYLEGRDGAVTRTVAGPGTIVPIGSGLEHTVRNESDDEATAFVVFAPGEPMERFIRAAGDADEILALAQAYGIEITRSIGDALVAAPPASAPFLTIARFSGDGDRLLDAYRTSSAVMDGVGRDHGLIVHAGAKTDSGFLVVNLWPSKESSNAAARDPRRLAAVKHAALRPDQIRREHHDVEHYVVFD